MRTYILYLFAALLALAGGPARAQQTKAKPDDPFTPKVVMITQSDRGTLTLDPAPHASMLEPGQKVEIMVTLKKGFVLAEGYPKVYQTGNKSEIVTVTNNTFTVPNYPFTVETQFASTDATLKSLKYTLNGETKDLDPTQKTQTISLPYGTAEGTVITLIHTTSDANASTERTNATISGGTGTATLTITAEHGETNTYTVNFTVKVLDSPTITTQPQNASVYIGDPIDPLTVEVSPVTGATLSYQWYSCTNADKEKATAITGATTSTYTPLTNEVGTSSYFCRVKATATDDATYSVFADSDVATVEVKKPLSTDATLKSLSYKIGADGTAQAITLGATTDFKISLPYATKKDATIALIATPAAGATIIENIPASLINGTGTATLTVTAEDGKTKNFYTVTFTVKVLASPTITIQPRGVSINVGGKIDLTVATNPVTGATLSYQWYSCTNANKENTAKITNATTSTYTPLTETIGTYYYFCSVTATATDDVTWSVSKDSDVATVEVKETPDDPSYTYTLHFEPNDSVRLTADWPVVEEGYSFTFTAEVAEGYDPATLAVEYKEGWYGTWKRLKPAADGITFRVPSVYSDIYVRATVFPTGHPTGVETVTEEVQVYTAGGTLFVQTPCKERVTVAAITGRLVSAEEQIGLRSYTGLPAGIYAVRVGDRLFKAHLR